MSALTQLPEQKQSVGFKHVLFATDFSSVSERAFACALPIVRRFHSKVSIVHVIPPDPGPLFTWPPLPAELDRERLKAEHEMETLAHQGPLHNLHPHLLVRKGRVWDVFSAVMEFEDTDLLVMGTHGRGGIKKLTLGSVTEEVMRLASCPVLSVGPLVPPADPERNEFKSILFATDFGPASTKAFAHALSLAENFQAKLVLLHSIPLMAPTETAAIAYCPGPCAIQDLMERQEEHKKESLRRLEALVPRATTLPQIEYVVGLETMPGAILDAADLHKVDLIVMGANRARSPRASAHIPWTHTHEVICKAGCPVLTVCC